jgi:hypothetical protein
MKSRDVEISTDFNTQLTLYPKTPNIIPNTRPINPRGVKDAEIPGPAKLHPQ